MKLPLLVVNFKTYSEATGINAEKLAMNIEKAALEVNKNVAVAVQTADLYRVSTSVNIPVFAQHLDIEEPGSFTGKVSIEAIKQNGAVGVLINHSEDQTKIPLIKELINKAKNAGLVTIVCANNEKIAEKISSFNPDIIAVEPPELIGGNVSVSKAKPEVITNSLKKVGKIPLLVGAGVKTAEDVKIAINLGSKGILLASGITKAKNPYETTKKLLKNL